jgi:type VII secretion-associated serine protease mycosin
VRVGTSAVRFAALASVSSVVLALSGLPAYADQYRNAQWYLKALRVEDAQRLTEGAGVTVAVIDTGVMASHPDLKGAVLPGSNVLGDGGDGRMDPSGHGTQMAGIIAARGRSGSRGVLGIAPQAKVLPVRPADGALLASKAIEWSVAHGAKVISMSFAIAGSDGLANAVKAAAAADVVLIAGSGNDGEQDSTNRYPGAYPEVLAVGAVDRNGKVAKFSTQGSQVAITAPGVDIPVADGHYPSGYAIVDGTSPATAIVAGAAALIRAKYPKLSAAQVVERLTSTAVDRGPPGRDDVYGYGELNLMAALTAKASNEPTTAGPTATDAPPESQPDSDDGGSGIPPIMFIGIGVVVLVGAVAAVFIAVRRSRGA